MSNVFLRVCFILCLILLIINVFAFVLFNTSDHVITFSEFLDRLEEAPGDYPDLNSTIHDFNITEDWGVLNGLRDFLNIFADVFGFIVWIGAIFTKLIIDIGYLLYLLGLSSFSALT